MVKQGVARNTTLLTMAYIGQKVLSFVYFVMIARFIGVEDLGKYTFALAFTTMFAVFIDLGLTQALIRETAKYIEKAGSYVTSIISAKVILSLVVYAAVVVVINVMGYPPLTKSLVYVSGVIMVLDSFTLSFWGTLRGAQNLKYESIGILINQFLIITLGLTVLLFKMPLIWLLMPLAVGSTFNVIFSAVMLKKKLGIKLAFNWDKKVLKFLFTLAVPFALLGIFTRVYGAIDSVLLSKMVGDSAVGWYATSLKIPFAFQFIPAAFAAAIFPAFSYFYIHDKGGLKRAFDKSMMLLAIFAVPISLGLFSIAPEMILTLFGEDFTNSILPLQVIAFALPFVFLNFPLGALMNSCEKHVMNTKLVGVTMVINIILNLILIPMYSFMGSAIAFVVSHAFLFGAGLIVAKGIIPYSKKYLVSTLVKTSISAVVMAAVIVFSKPYISWVVLIGVGAVIYGGLLYAIKGFTKDDVQYLLKAMKKKDA